MTVKQEREGKTFKKSHYFCFALSIHHSLVRSIKLKTGIKLFAFVYECRRIVETIVYFEFYARLLD